MKDDLGDRMKEQYEDRTRYMLPRRTYTIIRLDGKSFHTYTRGLEKPFDKDLSEDIDNAIIEMMPELQGSVFAYTQSDEISVLLTDFAQPTTSAWFDGNLQKMVSVSASVMTAEFNFQRYKRFFDLTKTTDRKFKDCKLRNNSAYFDSRAFTVPDRTEVMNYFIWRNKDCIRNAVSMIAQSKFSHRELQGISTECMREMLKNIGVDLETRYSVGDRNGRLIVKEEYTITNDPIYAPIPVTRSHWVSKDAWKFTEDKDKLLGMIPKYE